MLLPTAIQQALDLTLEHTLAAPELALNLALDLDDQLQDLGWRTPLTLSARGTATPDWLSETAKDQDSPAPSSTLHKADQLARDNKGQQAIALGFNQACGREIPALNLLYANHAL